MRVGIQALVFLQILSIFEFASFTTRPANCLYLTRLVKPLRQDN